jgi:hypothetical protein
LEELLGGGMQVGNNQFKNARKYCFMEVEEKVSFDQIKANN